MRVIAGSAGGLRLTTPKGDHTRPTADRVKEALFSALEPLTGEVVLDLYAGSGALAIEALSRGAAAAVVVEQDAHALEAVRHNLAATRLAERATVLREDAARFCRDPRGGPFTLVLLDPPYRESQSAVFARLTDLRAAGALVPDARVVLERDRRAEDPDPPGWLARERARSYGDTVLRWFRVGGPDPSAGPEVGPEEDS